MPLGFERLNERTQRPNTLINFIKPLSGTTSHLAQDFLERIAAIVYPVMKANHIAVMALEEYPPNPEFVGRNFNAGEVIQLVLKSRGGGWLPFKSVQMVMIHELAHCKQMNHSKFFWGVRNIYAEELRGLWVKGYTGDGFWSRGKTLLAREYETERVPDASEEPVSLCGGTFRSRGRKRKRATKGKAMESYAEKQQKWIRRKFGDGGVALGNDEGARIALEKGKIKSGKPRVAGSKRGRDLRAAAALARFEQVKKEEQPKEESDDDSSETVSEDEYEGSLDQQALDADGRKMLDQQGRGMFKVCEDEDKDDINVKRELDELYELDDWKSLPSANMDDKSQAPCKLEHDDSETEVKESRSKIRPVRDLKKVSQHDENGQRNVDLKSDLHSLNSERTQNERRFEDGPKQQDAECGDDEKKSSEQIACAVCSLENQPGSLTCVSCANVLNLSKLPTHWRCQSVSCRGSLYVNAGDCGICGACGAPKRLTNA